MKKVLTIITIVLGLSFSIAGNAKKLSPSESRNVLLNGQTIASGYDDGCALL